MITHDKIKVKRECTFIDIFCGIGGFHIALTQLGCKCVFACDIDENCRHIYQLNYGLIPHGDIYKQNVIPNHDILCAGFPCQSFSNGGKKLAFADKRGILIDCVFGILKTNRPPFAILENVKHIKRVSNGEVYRYIYNQLNGIGYEVFDVCISPTELGIPQHRERVIFVVVRCDLYSETFKQKFLLDLTQRKTLFMERSRSRTIYESSPSPQYNITDEITRVFTAWDDFIRIFSRVGEIISPVIPEYFTELESPDNKAWKNSYITKNNRFYQKHRVLLDSWYQKNKELLSKKAVYGKLEWQVGGIAQNDSINNYFVQIRQSGIRVKKTDCFPSLVAIVQTSIIPRLGRYLTPRECARLQCFPDTFDFGNQSDKLTYKQLGNSVNTDVVKIVAETLIKTHEFFRSYEVDSESVIPEDVVIV